MNSARVGSSIASRPFLFFIFLAIEYEHLRITGLAAWSFSISSWMSIDFLVMFSLSMPPHISVKLHRLLLAGAIFMSVNNPSSGWLVDSFGCGGLNLFTAEEADFLFHGLIISLMSGRL